MKPVDHNARIHDSIDNYYRYNPDTLMPLLMVALAVREKLHVGTSYSEGTTLLCEVLPEKVREYDWVRLDEGLKRRVEEVLASGNKTICVEGYVDESLSDIYGIFHRYDTFTVEEEYHHRIGILYEHSSNKDSEKAHRQYAAICLAEALAATPVENLRDSFLEISNHMLVKSGLQPERPRLQVAYALRTLLEYDGAGRVYNPFAGCAIAAAAINAGEKMYADGNANDKLFAVARLLQYGMGGSNEHYAQRDSEKWSDEGEFDYVMSTYRGYVGGQSAFDFCLSKCFNTLTESGKFAGIVAPRDIFENQSEEFKEALRRDWVEKIALLPFGEVAVLINAAKDKSLKNKVLFYNLTHPMLRSRSVGSLLENDLYADVLRVRDVQKNGYLRRLVAPEIVAPDDHEIVRLKDFVRKITKKSYSLDKKREDDRVLAYVNRKSPYDPHAFPWMNGIEKEVRHMLFAPVYRLTRNALIVNSRGALEPRIFDADFGSAFFDDGYAFAVKDPEDVDYDWLIGELNKPYVMRQLHPYGMDNMVPEHMTEDQILNLKLYKPVPFDFDFDDFDEDLPDMDSDKLPAGFVLRGQNTEYTIRGFLGHGYFGYTYSALSRNMNTGEQKEVVLKEFYPHEYFCRPDGVTAELIDEDNEDFVDENKAKFIEEARVMHKLGMIEDSHIVPAYEFFDSEETNTSYYVMPFYRDGSLDDLQKTAFSFTEKMILGQVVRPLCKALHVAHAAKVLHLDIKPENILVDENGDAILIDFGVAKQYDGQGNIIDAKGLKATSIFAPPELKHGNMVKFGSQSDIYGLAASIYYLLAFPNHPHPIFDFSDQDRDLRENLRDAGCSPKFIDAVVSGLQFSATSRPANAQAFLNMFPGCEEIVL